ncbi:nitrogen fixation protein NifX [Spirochaetia bacterium]|nr:nitrogen fixation protein NifX [Spirochaetia bacterium]
MAWRVAIASIDGILITEHFGRSRFFYVVDIQRDGSVVPVERRDVDPSCGTGGHSDSGLESVVSTLKDCAAVLVAKIGPGAQQQLQRRGIHAIEGPAVAEEAYKKLADYYIKTKFPENS